MVIGNPPPVSPYVYTARDSQGRILSATVPYDNSTRVINAPVTVHRDANCAFTKVIVDVGPDGTPDTSTKVINVAGLIGDRTFTVAQVNSIGLVTIDDILAHQITAAP